MSIAHLEILIQLCKGCRRDTDGGDPAEDSAFHLVIHFPGDLLQLAPRPWVGLHHTSMPIQCT